MNAMKMIQIQGIVTRFYAAAVEMELINPGRLWNFATIANSAAPSRQSTSSPPNGNNRGPGSIRPMIRTGMTVISSCRDTFPSQGPRQSVSASNRVDRTSKPSAGIASATDIDDPTCQNRLQ